MIDLYQKEFFSSLVLLIVHTYITVSKANKKINSNKVKRVGMYINSRYINKLEKVCILHHIDCKQQIKFYVMQQIKQSHISLGFRWLGSSMKCLTKKF